MEFVQENALWVIAAVVSGGMLLWPIIRGQSSGGVTPMQATIMINREDAIIVDVREPGEFGKGHIPNSRHIPLAQFGKRLAELDRYKDKPVIVNCNSGNRSMSACGALRKAGYSKVYNLAGGISAWEQAGLPLTTK